MTPWQLKTWGLAQTGNRASKTRHHLQWEDTEPERDTMPSGPQKLYHSTFCYVVVRAMCVADSIFPRAPLAAPTARLARMLYEVCAPRARLRLVVGPNSIWRAQSAAACTTALRALY